MARPLSQVVATLLFSALLAASVGAMCVLSVATAVHVPTVACHHGPTPSHPLPADHRCCSSDHRAALLNRVFSPRPTLQPLNLVNAHAESADAGESHKFPRGPRRSGSPPVVVILRI